MKRPAPLATTPSKGEGLKPQPQSSPRAVVGTPGKTAVAQLVGRHSLAVRPLPTGSGLLYALQRSARAAQIAKSGCGITVSTTRSLSVRAFPLAGDALRRREERQERLLRPALICLCLAATLAVKKRRGGSPAGQPCLNRFTLVRLMIIYMPITVHMPMPWYFLEKMFAQLAMA
eukprot:scaffold88491_cov63-Phaeocystis_antarctica.AAC.2